METTIPLKDMTFDYRDEFDRKSIAEKVIKLLDSEIDFCPMAIDGGWGTGKTEFCHKLINLIKEQDTQRRKTAQEAAGNASQAVTDTTEITSQSTLPPERAVIYLNAFASETVDDPLLCILAAIRAEFPDENTKREICQKAVPVVKTLCKVAGKAMFAHAFKQDLEDVSEAVAEAASDGVNSLIDQTVDKLLDQYADAQKNLDALKAVIATATAQRPILFFIDELDRCRPDFALSILELVKHVFDIPGIKFIFVANLEQLKAAIRKRYGQDVDADVYLEKFINLSIIIPPVHNRTNINASYLLLKKEFSGVGIFDNDESIYSEFILHLILKYSINLRGIKKLIQNIKIYASLNNNYTLNKRFSPGYNITFLLSIFIYTFNDKLRNKYILEDVGTDIFDFLGKSEDDTLGCLLAVLGSLIYHTEGFSSENVECSLEQKEKIKNIVKYLCRNDYGMNYSSFRKILLRTIQTMNFLPVYR